MESNQNPHNLLESILDNDRACSGGWLEDCLSNLRENPGTKDAILDAIARKHTPTEETDNDWDIYLDTVKAAYFDVLPHEQAESEDDAPSE